MPLQLQKGTHFVANIIGLKLGWLACVLGGANGKPWLGPAVVALIVAVHLALSERAGREKRLLAMVAVIGLSWDSLLAATGLMVYPSGQIAPGLAPYWIVAMWVLFATGLNVALAWLKGRPMTAVVFGGIGGAMAFYGGYKLGGVNIPDLPLGLITQGIGWAVIMPTLSWLAARFDGVSPADQLTYTREKLA